MDPSELLRIVDAIHRDKNIDKEIVFEGIEAALVSAAKKHFGEDEEIVVQIDRTDGAITGTHNGEPLSPEEMAERVGAQTAKQVMIQKIREAERDSLFDEYEELKGQLVTGMIQRYEGGAATVTLSNVEAILPRGEQIPGETHHANERVRAVVYEVRKVGSRIKVILSRTKPQLVQRLFEQEIPEIAEGVIQVKAIAREPGYRTKVAVSSNDQRVDCVGACVGVRGNRIKNIVDELGGERIDIVRHSDDMQLLIPYALQPAEVEEVILCQMLGRAIVLVREDQLSLAIGRRGQNVRLASKLCGWDIEIMTRDELDDQIEQAVVGYASLEGVEDELAEKLVGEGFLSYDDLSVIEPDALAEMGDLTPEHVDQIVRQAEVKAEEAEEAAAEQRRLQREQERLEAAMAAAAAAQADAAAAQTDAAAAQTDADHPLAPATEQPADQPTDQPTDQPADQPADQPTDQPTDEPADQTTDQPADEPADQTTDQTTDQPTDEPSSAVGDQAAPGDVSVDPATEPTDDLSVPPREDPTEPNPPPPQQVKDDPTEEAG